MAHEYGLLPQADEDALHTAHDGRLLVVERVNFAGLAKKVLSINKLDFSSKPKIGDEEETEAQQSERPTPATDSEDNKAYYEQCRNDLLLAFASFDSTVIRAQLTIDSNKLERDRYAEEKIELNNTTQTVRQNNAALHEELKEAQATLETRKGYDKLTEKITNDSSLKPRDEQQAAIDKLNAEIAELEIESQDYVRTRAERGEQFGRIVAECKHLLGLIHGDREEVERKDAMEGASSREATPAGGSTPAHAPIADEVPAAPHGSRLKEQTVAVEPVTDGLRKDKPETDVEMQDEEQVGEAKPDQDTRAATTATSVSQTGATATPADEAGQSGAEAPGSAIEHTQQEAMDET